MSNGSRGNKDVIPEGMRELGPPPGVKLGVELGRPTGAKPQGPPTGKRDAGPPAGAKDLGPPSAVVEAEAAAVAAGALPTEGTPAPADFAIPGDEAPRLSKELIAYFWRFVGPDKAKLYASCVIVAISAGIPVAMMLLPW